ncbi:MAG: hypothetical protein L0H84_18090, partial [Pseudonocardia sp.]|nr:hypothetical protein [Pseudonocardia sp.]
LDAGTGTATWTSLDRRPDPWVTAHAPHAGGDPPVPLPFGDRPRWIGPAPTSTLPPPELTVRSSRADGADTLLVLHLDSMRGAQLLTLHADRPVTGVELAVDGLAPVATTPTRGAGPWPFELQFSAPPPTGVEVRVRLPGHGPLRLALTDYTVGLPTPARSAALTASTRTTSDLVGGGRIHLIDARAIGRGVGWPGR